MFRMSILDVIASPVIKRWIVACALIGAATDMVGCVGLPKVRMSPEDRAQTKTIVVRVDERMPEDMSFWGREQSLAVGLGAAAGSAAGYALAGKSKTQGLLLGGLAGGAVAAPLYSKIDDSKSQLLATMRESNINLPAIVQEEFIRAMRSQGDFGVVRNGAAADAEMVLIVNSYGIGQVHGFSSLYPSLNVSASLRKPDGTVIWQQTDYVTAFNSENDVGHEFSEFIAQPSQLRDAWEKVAGIVSRMLVKELSLLQ